MNRNDYADTFCAKDYDTIVERLKRKGHDVIETVNDNKFYCSINNDKYEGINRYDALRRAFLSHFNITSQRFW